MFNVLFNIFLLCLSILRNPAEPLVLAHTAYFPLENVSKDGLSFKFCPPNRFY